MKAARYYSGKRGLTVEEVDAPVPGEGEVLVAIKAAGLCGTDLHIAREQSFPTARSPITLGHEGAGVIVALGAGVSDWSVGERVTFYPSISCGSCRACKGGRISLCPTARILGVHTDGTFAELISVPAGSLIKLPASVSFEIGAILSDAVATAYHAVCKRGALNRGERVAIFGCGGVGCQAIIFARQAGAARIIAVDLSAGALARAEQVGATDLVRGGEEAPSKTIKALTAGEGVEAAFEFVGSARTVMEAMRSVGRPGRVIVVGVGADKVELPPLTSFVGKELSLIGSMGSYREDLTEVIELVTGGKISLDEAVTHRFALTEVNAAMETLATKKGAPVRVVVEP